MSATRTLTVVACLAMVAPMAGCGSSNTPNATKPKSFEAALGLDQASINARETKVQEAVRVCMKSQGFDYVPLDPSQSNMKISIGGISSGGPGGASSDPEFRRTKGYGISTGLTDAKPASPSGGSDPNQKIREALSEADRKAYDLALFGEVRSGEGEAGGGRVAFRRSETAGPGSSSDKAPQDQSCFGKAQQEVPGGPQALGDSIKELMQRIDGDPRLVQANQAWASCMAQGSFSQFETPDAIVKYLIEKMQALTGSSGDGISIGPDTQIDQTKLSQLQQEELAIAKADDACAKKSGRTKVEKQVREEAQQRFLDEHPDLTGGS